MLYLSFSVWLISLSLMPSRFIYVVMSGRIPFFLMAEWHSIVLYHIPFVHSSIDGYLGCFHIMIIVDKASVNTGVQIFKIWFSFPLDLSLEAGLLDRMVVFRFLRNLHAGLHSGCTTYIPTNIAWVFLFSRSLPTLVISFLFDDGCPNRQGVILGIWFAFPWWLVMLASFHMPVGHVFVSQHF